jgi:small-conductance mechanosensitive channel
MPCPPEKETPMPAFILLLYRFFRGLWNGLKDKDFRNLFLWLIAIILLGSWFYARVEHWTLLDAIYFSITTLATVGYGDFSPHTAAGKIFTIFYIIIGIGMLSGFIVLLAERSGLMKRKPDALKAGEEKTTTDEHR